MMYIGNYMVVGKSYWTMVLIRYLNFTGNVNGNVRESEFRIASNKQKKYGNIIICTG